MEKILELQAQSSLAKLLAKENITVTHSKTIETAYFDIKNRVLGLPIWKDQGKVVYDMLVGHEVSHALYTPNDKFETFLEENGRNNFDILNVIEDIRIERLIKKTYSGMPRIFKGAYKQLVEKDFFNIKGKDLSGLKFIDRLNLQGKIGDLVDIPLNDEERELYEECFAAQTFDEVVDLYHKIKEFADAQEKIEKPQPQENSEPQNSQSNEDEGEEDNDYDNFFSDDEGGQSESHIPQVDDIADDGTESHSISSEVTDEDFEKAMDELFEQAKNEVSESTEEDSELGQESADGKSDSHGKDVEISHTAETLSSLNENLLDDTVKTTHSNVDIAIWPSNSVVEDRIVGYKTLLANRDSIEKQAEKYGDDDYAIEFIAKRKESILDLRGKINKKVSILAREFERRKAAYQYSRAQESRRGSLDVNKLHKYKYDDQIFQTTMRLADAKSHGMIFFIDYSGSMSNVLKDVLEHTLNLVHFCKKVGIPFQVFAFTSNYSFDNDKKLTQSKYEFDLSDLVLSELFSSEMSKKDYDVAFNQVCSQVIDSNDYVFSQQGISKWEHLGGTPLNATLISAKHIVEKFKKKNPVEKMNVVILTDGDSHACRPRHTGYNVTSYLTMIGGKQHTINRDYHVTEQLTKILKQITGATVIGFFLPGNRKDANRHLNRMAANTTKEAYAKAGEWMKKYRKDNLFHITNCFGYDSYFLLDSNMKIVDEDFDFNENSNIAENKSSQTKLARQFAKHNVANRTNRVLMTQFAKIIA